MAEDSVHANGALMLVLVSPFGAEWDQARWSTHKASQETTKPCRSVKSDSKMRVAAFGDDLPCHSGWLRLGDSLGYIAAPWTVDGYGSRLPAEKLQRRDLALVVMLLLVNSHALVTDLDSYVWSVGCH